MIRELVFFVTLAGACVEHARALVQHMGGSSISTEAFVAPPLAVRMATEKLRTYAHAHMPVENAKVRIW
jgi:hypothetical protein